MTRTAEVYVFYDKRYAHDLSGLLDDIKAAGHRVLTGGNAAELTMLLQVGLPTAVIYTLADERSIDTAEFQMASKRVMDLWLPLILVGPGPVEESLSLRLPESSGVMERYLTAEEVPVLIGELAELTHHEKPPLLSDDDSDDSDLTALEEAMVDTVGSPGEQLRIETRIIAGDRARILTTVTRDDALLVREEHDIPSDEVDLFGRMEAQHLMALASYAPKTPSFAPGPVRNAFKGEVSAPFFIDDSLRRLHEERTLEQRVKKLATGLAAATIVAVSTTVAATLMWDIPLPRPLSPGQEIKAPIAAENTVLPPVANRASTKLAKLRSAYMWPPEPSPLGEEALAFNGTEAGELPFPARFEAGTSRFSLQDPDEAARFMSMLTSLSTAHDIWVVGHATFEEVAQGDSQLAKQRAVEVLRYLAEHGVPKDRLHAVRGEPVSLSADLEPDGSPRQRFVGIVIEE